MLGRGGAWTGLAKVAATSQRYWYYQDFPAGSGPILVATANENGTGGGTFDPSKIISGSAVVTTIKGNPLYSTAAQKPEDLVTVTTQTTDTAELNAVPLAAQGPVRLWYLYGTDSPAMNMQLAPEFVMSQRAQEWDARYLNGGLNLADLTDPVAARNNLGFVNAASGAVLFGDGSSTPASDPTKLFWDNPNDRLGVGLGAPAHSLHVYSDTDPVAEIETQSGLVPELRLQSAAAGNANQAAGVTTGILSFFARYNAISGAIATVKAVYQGNGLTRLGDLVFTVSSGSGPIEALRLKASGVIKTLLGAGVVQSDASGNLSSGTVPMNYGGTGATSIAAGAVYSDGTQLTSETALSPTRGGTGLTSLGTAGQALGVNNAGTALSYKPTLISDDGHIYVPAGLGLSGAPALTFQDGASSGLSYDAANNQVIIYQAGQPQFRVEQTRVVVDRLHATIGIGLEDPGVGTNRIVLRAPTLTADSTITLPPANAVGVLKNDGNGNTSWGVAATPEKAGVIALADGAYTQAVSFTTPRADANYTPIVNLANTVDMGLAHQPWVIINILASGFTVEFSEPVQGTNWKLYWGTLAHQNP